MKVVILSAVDYAGSGLRIKQAVEKVSDIQIDAFVWGHGSGNKKFNISTGPSIVEAGEDKVRKLVRDCDIVHYKGDWPFGTNFYGIPIPPDKKIIYTFSGGLFRRNRPDHWPKSLAFEKYPLESYKGDMLTAVTPEMLYLPDMVLTPFPWIEFKYTFKEADRFIVSHIPSTPVRKGTPILTEAIDILNRQDVEFKNIQGVSREESLSLKRESHIYVDQLILPVYGNSAVEAMSMGVPVLSWDEDLYPYKTPIIKPWERTPQKVAEALDYWLDWNRLKELSERTFEYCRDVHGGVGNLWVKLYNDMICNTMD